MLECWWDGARHFYGFILCILFVKKGIVLKDKELGDNELVSHGC